MSFGKLVMVILGSAVILFGFLVVWGAFDKTGGGWLWLVGGLVIMAIGAVPVYFAIRKPASDTSNIILKIDLPGNVNMDTIKCKSCGGAITSKDINMVAGAPVVTCPYCNTTYQLSEEPKW